MKVLIIKYHRLIFITLIVLVNISSIIQVFPGEQVELTSQIHENREFQCRLFFAFEKFDFFIMKEIKNSEEYEFLAGISTDWFIFGPVYTYGLFREIENPLGYSPGSGIFSEKSGLHLKSAFDPGPKRFLVLQPIPGYVTLFYQTGAQFLLSRKDSGFPGFHISNEIPQYWGGQGFYSFGDIFATEVLVSCSEPERKIPGDEWFSPDYMFDRGKVYHISMKNHLTTAYGSASVSGSVSRGDMILPGYFIHNYITADIAWCTLSLLFGYCSPWYITPGGSFTSGMIRTGGLLQLNPLPWLSSDIWYYVDIDHPGADHTDFLSISHRGGGKISTEHVVMDNHLLSFLLEDELRVSFDDQGEKQRTNTMSLEFSYAMKQIKIDTTLTGVFKKDEELTWVWETRFVRNKGIHSCVVKSKLGNEDTLFWEGKLEYRMNKDAVDVWSSLSCKKEIQLTEEGFSSFTHEPFHYLSISAGFKVVHK